MIRTVGQLIAELQDWPEDAPLRVAYQSAWPLVAMVDVVDSAREATDERPAGVCWLVLAAGAPEGERPYAPKGLFS